MPDCPDLRQLAGNRYRLAHDHNATVRATDDPWLLTIPCQYGHVYPHGPGRLAFASHRRGEIARAVAALPGAIIEQDATDGPNISFPVELFEQVAAIVKPRKRRQLSPEQRQAASARLAAYKFPARQSDKTTRPATQTA